MKNWCLCPFCGGDECEHLVGWTADGRTIFETLEGILDQPAPVLSEDRIVKTGVAARVYRPTQTAK